MADDDDLEAYVQKRGRAAYPWKRPPSSSQYKPGQSGNPGGLSSFYREGRKIAQRAAPEMMERLIELARTAKDERVRSGCIIGILDRAGLRPIDYDASQDTANRLDNLTLEQNRARLAELGTLIQQILGATAGLAAPAATANGADHERGDPEDEDGPLIDREAVPVEPTT